MIISTELWFYRPSFKIPFGQLKQHKITFLDTFPKFKLTTVIKHSLVNNLTCPLRFFKHQFCLAWCFCFFFFPLETMLVICEMPIFLQSLHNKLVQWVSGKRQAWEGKYFSLTTGKDFSQWLLTVEIQGTSPSRKERELSFCNWKIAFYLSESLS